LSTVTVASDSASNDHFGYSCSTDGFYMVVGCPDKNSSAGAAYIYKRSDTTNSATWVFDVKLVSNTPASNYYFGYSVYMNNGSVVVGEYGNNKTHVWILSSSTWTKQTVLTSADTSSAFGKAVAINGDYIASGATNSVYVYVRSGTTWSQQQKITATSASSVALENSNLIIGCSSANLVYVYTRTNTTWSVFTTLVQNDAVAGDGFGSAVALSGNYIVVGAVTHDEKSPVLTDNGAAYIFYYSNGAWTQQQKITAGDFVSFDYFGNCVAIKADTAIIGSYHKTVNGNVVGAAHVVKRSGTNWSRSAILLASDAAANDAFGFSVAISDKYVCVGATGYE
jgi:hypothetical protein